MRLFDTGAVIPIIILGTSIAAYRIVYTGVRSLIYDTHADVSGRTAKES
jgi:hypothetical protein